MSPRLGGDRGVSNKVLPKKQIKSSKYLKYWFPYFVYAIKQPFK